MFGMIISFIDLKKKQKNKQPWHMMKTVNLFKSLTYYNFSNFFKNLFNFHSHTQAY